MGKEIDKFELLRRISTRNRSTAQLHQNDPFVFKNWKAEEEALQQAIRALKLIDSFTNMPNFVKPKVAVICDSERVFKLLLVTAEYTGSFKVKEYIQVNHKSACSDHVFSEYFIAYNKLDTGQLDEIVHRLKESGAVESR